jgi:hypothetical protein
MRSDAPGPGHNTGLLGASQWQDPRVEEAPPQYPSVGQDLDLVEQEFYRSVLNSADPTSLLRLARVPFVADLGDGRLMRLLRVSLSDEIEVGAISPGFGGDDVVLITRFPLRACSTRETCVSSTTRRMGSAPSLMPKSEICPISPKLQNSRNVWRRVGWV